MTEFQGAVTAPGTQVPGGSRFETRGGFRRIAGGCGGFARGCTTTVRPARAHAELGQPLPLGTEGRDEQLAEAEGQIVSFAAGGGEVLRRLLTLRLEPLAKSFEASGPIERRPQIREMLLQGRDPGALLRCRGEQRVPFEQRIGKRDFRHDASPSSGVPWMGEAPGVYRKREGGRAYRAFAT